MHIVRHHCLVSVLYFDTHRTRWNLLICGAECCRNRPSLAFRYTTIIRNRNQPNQAADFLVAPITTSNERNRVLRDNIIHCEPLLHD